MRPEDPAGPPDLRVLLAIDSGRVGGGQVHLRALARGLRSRGVTAAILVSPDGPLGEEMHGEGFEVVSFPFPRRPDPRALAGLRNLLAARSGWVLHTHGGVAGAWVRLGSLGLPVARVHTFHGIHYLHFDRPLARLAYTAIDRFLSAHTHRTIFVSQGDLEAGTREGIAARERSRVIYHGFDPARFLERRDPGECRRRLGLPETPVLLGTVGRFHVQKGQEFLIRALPELDRVKPGVHLALVGEGPLGEELAALARALGVGDRITFLPPGTDIPVFLWALDLFALPSLWEGLPITLLEALAASRPVVATDVAGNRELLDPGPAGLLCPARDPAALARAMASALMDPAGSQERVRAGIRRVREGFTFDRMIDGTAGVYREALSEIGRK